MPRIRTIKPEFWSDEKVVELTPLARLLFIGLWNFADDSGNGERSSRQIKMRIFPGDNLDIDPLIEELIQLEFICEYEVDGKKYLNIRNFSTHQKINRPSASKFPPPPKKKTLTEDSRREGKGMEVKILEGKGKERILDLPQPVDNSNAPPLTTGATDGGNAQGHPPVAPTPEEMQNDLVRLRLAQGIPASGRKAH